MSIIYDSPWNVKNEIPIGRAILVTGSAGISLLRYDVVKLRYLNINRRPILRHTDNPNRSFLILYLPPPVSKIWNAKCCQIVDHNRNDHDKYKLRLPPCIKEQTGNEQKSIPIRFFQQIISCQYTRQKYKNKSCAGKYHIIPFMAFSRINLQ